VRCGRGLRVRRKNQPVGASAGSGEDGLDGGELSRCISRSTCEFGSGIVGVSNKRDVLFK
jgi:hypothetical protein